MLNRLLVTIIFLLCCLQSHAQVQSAKEIHHETMYPGRLLVHYTVEELDEMRQNDTLKFAMCLYYHCKSYEVQRLPDVEAPYFDLDTFDITPYERFRHPTLTVVKTDWKKGLQIELLPIDQLEYKLPIHLPTLENSEENEE